MLLALIWTSSDVMILRSILILLPFVALAVCVSFKDLAPQLKGKVWYLLLPTTHLTGFYPKKLANFYNSLTVDQEKLIDDAIMSNSSSREAQYMAIKKKNPELESKFKGVNEDFVKNLSSLSYYANNYYYFRVGSQFKLSNATLDPTTNWNSSTRRNWRSIERVCRRHYSRYWGKECAV